MQDRFSDHLIYLLFLDFQSSEALMGQDVTLYATSAPERWQHGLLQAFLQTAAPIPPLFYII